MSYQHPFLGYYLIKSQQLKKQTHSLKMRNFHHRERTDGGGGRPWRTAPVSAGRPPLPAAGGRSAPPSAGRGGRRPHRPLGKWPPKWTSGGRGRGHPKT
jgi:hypothetical protein